MSDIYRIEPLPAQLDPGRRQALFEALGDLGAQVWMTGADPQAFADIGADAQMVDIAPGRIVSRS